MYKNEHIQLDIQTSNSLSSSNIDTATIMEYIENETSEIKVYYTCYYDDFEEYKNAIQETLDKITSHYATQNKIIHTKFKIYWN